MPRDPMKLKAYKNITNRIRVIEASKNAEGKKTFRVVIIQEGLGNLKDRNYYTADAIKSGPEIYDGKKFFFDHPSEKEEQEHPLRKVRDIGGHYENCTAKEVDGEMQLQADAVPMSGPQGDKAIGLLESAVNYSKKYPDKDFIGLSINGDGEGLQMEWDDFVKEISPSSSQMKKLTEIEGQQINVIMKFTSAVSADLVTEAGAKGRVTSLKESIKSAKRRRTMLEAMKKFFRGIESNDPKVIESAAKELAEDGMTENEPQSGADTMVKHMLQMKKEMKQEEGEEQEAYEKRVISAAYKAAKEEEAAQKKEGEEGDKKEEFPPKKDAAADGDKKPADGEKKDEKPAEGDKKEGDDKSMSEKLASLEKAMEDMKKKMEGYEGDTKAAKESAAVANTELTIKKRADLIEGLLAKSGWPRNVTKLWKPVLEACKTEEQMKKTIKNLDEAAEKVQSELMSSAFSGRGSGEKQTVEVGKESNDDLFS